MAKTYAVRNPNVSEFVIEDLGQKIPGLTDLDLINYFSVDTLDKSQDLEAAFIASDLLRLDQVGGSQVPAGEEMGEMAGGDLTGVYSNPEVIGLREGGGQNLTYSTIADGKFFRRSGTQVVGTDASVTDTIRFVSSGALSAGSGIDGAWIAPRAGSIERVTLWRRTAGSSGSTVVDVNKNGTTLYTTQSNRPTVTQAAGDNAIDATTDFDVTTFAQDDRIEVDVDAVEAGSPLDLAVIITVRCTP